MISRHFHAAQEIANGNCPNMGTAMEVTDIADFSQLIYFCKTMLQSSKRGYEN
jgi:hypothetical protein